MTHGDHPPSPPPSPSSNFEIDLEITPHSIETQHLIPDSDTSITPPPSPLLSDSRNERIPSVLIVILSFLGISFYFFTKPRASRTFTDELAPGIRPLVAPTVLISIDGYRHDYLSRKDDHGQLLAPNLNSIASRGVHAINGMQPVVPTKTFPNHWTLVTGLYPEYHGIVDNTMYDPLTEKWFHLNRIHPDWWYGEPIWQTLRNTPRVVVQPNGTRTELADNYTTACVFWPGSEVPKHAANVFWTYDKTKSYEERVNRVLDLLEGRAKDLDTRAQFVTLYFEGVDHAGHGHGPGSHEVMEEIKKADDAVGLLLRGLGDNWWDEFNIIVISDHGMTEVSEERVIDLSSAVPQGTVQDIVTSPLGAYLNVSVSADKLFEEIKRGFEGHEEHAAVYMKEDIPERWHLRESRLIPPVVTMASLGWTVTYPHQRLVPDADDPLGGSGSGIYVGKGNHGFDNTFEDMQAIFIAQGPRFRSGFTFTNMRSLDLYEMICYMFGAKSAPNNGSLQVTRAIFNG